MSHRFAEDGFDGFPVEGGVAVVAAIGVSPAMSGCGSRGGCPPRLRDQLVSWVFWASVMVFSRVSMLFAPRNDVTASS